jgi:hypothetical protein
MAKPQSDNEQVERPLKRPKVASESSQGTGAFVRERETSQEAQMAIGSDFIDDEDEELPQALTDVPRASDLYLDTASGMFRQTSARLTDWNRSTELSSTLILKRSAPCRCRTSTYMGVLSVVNTSKDEGGIRMLTRTQSMRTITFSLIWRLPR